MDVYLVLTVTNILAIGMFGIARRRLKPQTLQVVSLVTLIIYMIVVLYFTIFSRTPIFETRINITPFQGDQGYELLSTLLTQLLPNILIFIPIGLFLRDLLWRHKMIYTILIGIGISISIELVQLFVHVGICDIDDLIANSIGCIFGVLSAQPFRKKQKDIMT